MIEIKNNIESADMESLRFNAHGLKGVLSNFVIQIFESFAEEL